MKKLLLLLMFIPCGIYAQEMSGVVSDAMGPLPGVNIKVQGTSNGTTTDFDGNYALKNLKKGDKVDFSYVGYKVLTIVYNGQKSQNVTLQEDAKQLDEVVLVGYGAVKKRDATGSVSTVSAKDFNKGAITSVDGLLNGRTSGVVVTSSGTPGNDAKIVIRGGSSLQGGNDPLIVVDGLPIDGGLSSVNPNDIESFSILKDASSTAIYGNRGANGVILITTKRGSAKEMQVSLNTFTTYNTLAKKADVYNASEYTNLIRTQAPDRANLLGYQLYDASGNPIADDPNTPNVNESRGYDNTDWQSKIFRKTFSSDVNLQVLGNLFNKVPARLSLGNTDNNGILITSEFKRTTGSLSLNPTFFDDHLKINLTANYSYTYRRNADEGAIGAAISMDPTKPAYYDPLNRFGGYFEWTDPVTGNPRGPANPISTLRNRRDISNQKRYFGNINVEYKFHFLPELKAILNAGVDNQDGDNSTEVNAFSRSGYYSVTPLGTETPSFQYVGSSSHGWWRNRNRNSNVQLNYNKAIGKLNLDLLAGYEYQQFDRSNFSSGNTRVIGTYVTSDFADVYTDAGNNLQAFLGRANIGYNDKYLLTVNFRRDGSSKVSPVNKWANFAGFAFAWKIKDEKFMKDIKLFSDLKLRLSYGQNGNQDARYGQLPWLKTYNISNNVYYQLGNEYILVARPNGYNSNLKWERSTKYNAGIDFAFLDNRLRGTLDGYYSKTTDMYSVVMQGALQNLSIEGPGNVGSMTSKGVDVGLNYDAIQKENFNLNLNYNVTYNKIEITDLYTNGLNQGGVGLNGFVQTHRIGLAPFSYWVYQQVYDEAGRPITGSYVDRNGDGVITSDDKYNYKKPNADVTMGFMTNATIYKKWDVSMAWRASFGNYVYDQVSSNRAYLNQGINNTVDNTLNNTTKDYNTSGFLNRVAESDYYVKDGSFLKLDNITVGYKFTNLVNEKTSMRVYLGVQNALIITKYKNMDPEVFNNGMDNTIFPRARMFMLGVNTTF